MSYKKETNEYHRRIRNLRRSKMNRIAMGAGIGGETALERDAKIPVYHPRKRKKASTIAGSFVKVTVIDANDDKYNLDFEVENSQEGLSLICPWCGSRLNPYNGEACANGHLAYTINDEDVEQKAIAKITDESST